MKDERISFETAVLAKAKGFDLLVEGYFTNYQDGKVEYDKVWMKNGERSLGDYSCDSYTCYAAPSQSLLQRWLREVHDMHVQASVDHRNEKGDRIKCFDCDVILYEKRRLNYKYSKYDLPTYEEALEHGLKEALRLLL